MNGRIFILLLIVATMIGAAAAVGVIAYLERGGDESQTTSAELPQAPAAARLGAASPQGASNDPECTSPARSRGTGVLSSKGHPRSALISLDASQSWCADSWCRSASIALQGHSCRFGWPHMQQPSVANRLGNWQSRDVGVPLSDRRFLLRRRRSALLIWCILP